MARPNPPPLLGGKPLIKRPPWAKGGPPFPTLGVGAYSGRGVPLCLVFIVWALIWTPNQGPGGGAFLRAWALGGGGWALNRGGVKGPTPPFSKVPVPTQSLRTPDPSFASSRDLRKSTQFPKGDGASCHHLPTTWFQTSLCTSSYFN